MSKSNDTNWRVKKNKRGSGKVKFTPTEDQKLLELVGKYGEDWEIICTFMPGRNTRQVRERWTNYVSPTINRDPFTEEEDALLLDKVAEYGFKWVMLTQFFNKRTDSALKNRYQLIERRIAKGKLVEYAEPAKPVEVTVPLVPAATFKRIKVGEPNQNNIPIEPRKIHSFLNSVSVS